MSSEIVTTATPTRNKVLRNSLGIVLLLVFGGAVSVALGMGAARTVVVDAKTAGFKVTMRGSAHSWPIGDVHVCNARDALDWRAPRLHEDCDPRRYEYLDPKNITLNFNDGAVVEVQSLPHGRTALKVYNVKPYNNGSILFLPVNIWDKVGLFTYTGEVTIGAVAGTGELRSLHSGQYEFRETTFWSESTETIKSGTLRRGEEVSFETASSESARSTISYGYFRRSEDSTSRESKLEVGLVTESGLVDLKVNYFGGTQPVLIAPNWIDRTLNSPLVLALSVVMSFFAMILQFLFHTNPVNPLLFRGAKFNLFKGNS